MSFKANPADNLEDPEVRRYFLEILEGGLSSEEKYDKFIHFFKLERKVEEGVYSYGSELLTGDKQDIERILSEVGQKAGIWKPNEILKETEDGIKRAIRRLKISQHQDGGWGRQIEQSIAWDTAYAVMCLQSALTCKEFAVCSDDSSFESTLRKGIDWLKRRYSYGHERAMASSVSAGQTTPEGTSLPEEDRTASVYDVSLVVRTYFQIGEESFPIISRFVDRLVESQNADGGWDASIWGIDHTGPARVFSEVGATSAALRALDEVKGRNMSQNIQTGVRWLIDNQNNDGSWNNGSCLPGLEGIRGRPSINKTCDGLKGLALGAIAGVKPADLEPRIEKAVEWIQAQEKPILDRDRKITGWGWISNEELSDLENTALTLETLVCIENVSLLLLTANAQWLLKNQYTAEGSPEDGAWEFGHTPRVGRSLIEFYKRIKESSLFE